MDVLRRSAVKYRTDKIRNKEIKEITGVQEKPDIIEYYRKEKITVVWPCQKNARTEIT